MSAAVETYLWTDFSLFSWKDSQLSVFGEHPRPCSSKGFAHEMYLSVTKNMLQLRAGWRNASVLFFAGDMISLQKAQSFGLLSSKCSFRTAVFTRVDGWACAVLAPTPSELAFENGLGFAAAQIRTLKGLAHPPWNELLPHIFWRGGRHYPHSCAHLLQNVFDPRQALVQRSLTTQWLNASFEKCALHTFLRYRYLLDVGGTSCTTFDALRWKLASGRLVFRVMLPAADWFHRFVQEGVHYVPIAADLSNLEQQFRWANDHPQLAQKIAERGKAVAELLPSRSANRRLVTALMRARVQARTHPLAHRFPHCHYGACRAAQPSSVCHESFPSRGRELRPAHEPQWTTEAAGHQSGTLSPRDRDLLCDRAIPFKRERTGVVRWLHIPKSGTAFANTIFRHGCDVPDGYNVPEGKHVELEFARKFPPERCARMMDATPNTHNPLGMREIGALSAFVTMMRAPGARACSAAVDRGGHCSLDCNPENPGCTAPVRGGSFDIQMATANLTKPPGGLIARPTECWKLLQQDIRTYATDAAVQGCSTKMLLGLPCNANVTLPKELALLAASRLETFAFVGLVEEWDLSVCLFHRIFGGSPARAENAIFGSNPLSKSRCNPNTVAVLRDPADELVYAAAQNHFWRLLQRVLSNLKSQGQDPPQTISFRAGKPRVYRTATDLKQLLGILNEPLKKKEVPRVIWLLWLQGWDAAPLLVRDIMRSWQVHNPQWSIALLDASNVLVLLGGRLSHCLSKFKGGHEQGQKCIMSGAAVSDVIRLTLLTEYGGVWADATVLCMQPLDNWVHSAVQPAGFWMYRGRHDFTHLGPLGKQGLPSSLQQSEFMKTGALPEPSGVPCSWFMVSLPHSSICTSWLREVDGYWKTREWPSGDVGGLRDYFWLDGLFFKLLGMRDDFERSWQRVPFLDAYGAGASALLSGSLQAQPLQVNWKKKLLENAPFVMKLSHKLLNGDMYRNATNERLTNGEYAVAVSLSNFASPTSGP